MTERQLQFRVGLLVVVAGIVAVGLVFRFGEMRSFWENHYVIGVHFDRAPGVEKGTPVRKNGILIGNVRAVTFDDAHGGVNVLVEVRDRYQLRKDSQPMLTRSLLGDATLEFSPGKSREILKAGDKVEGQPSEDPFEIIARFEAKTTETLESFASTSEEWRKVAKNVNELTDTHRGNIEKVIEEAAESLHQFTITMKNANKTVADPENQENLKATLAAMPQMMDDARKMIHDTGKTIQSVRSAVVKADAALGSITEVTAPLAKRSSTIAARLDNSIASLEAVLGEMAVFSRAINSENGSLKLLASDPKLYHNLNQAAESLHLMLRNLEPAMRDAREFADKIARHPELLGVSGAMKGSPGVKDTKDDSPAAKERISRGKAPSGGVQR